MLLNHVNKYNLQGIIRKEFCFDLSDPLTQDCSPSIPVTLAIRKRLTLPSPCLILSSCPPLLLRLVSGPQDKSVKD